MSPIDSPSDAAAFFRNSGTPIYYVCTTPSNLLGLRHWVENLHFLCAADFYDEALPHIAYPAKLEAGDTDSFVAMNERILGDPGVLRYIREHGPGGHALFLMFDEANEASARAAGLSVCFPPAAMRQRIDDKIATTRLGDAAGVRSAPNVLAHVESYAALRRLSGSLGTDLVMQLPFGDSGTTTFFISSEVDYLPYARAIEAAPEVKIMRRVRCRQAAIEACVTRNGVAVGPLVTELIGFPELTSLRGAWCGNEVGPALFSPAIVDDAASATHRIGAQLGAIGYRGVFGLDFLIDEPAGDMFLGELNPRITGATPLSTQAARDVGVVPLMVLHLLEWLEVPHRIDIEEVSARLRKLDGCRGFHQLIVKDTRDVPSRFLGVPPSGIWSMGESGAAFARASFDTNELADDREALVLRGANRGFASSRGYGMARVLMPGRAMTSGYELLARTRAWIASVRAAFAFGEP